MRWFGYHRSGCDIRRSRLRIEGQNLWRDLLPYLKGDHTYLSGYLFIRNKSFLWSPIGSNSNQNLFLGYVYGENTERDSFLYRLIQLVGQHNIPRRNGESLDLRRFRWKDLNEMKRMHRLADIIESKDWGVYQKRRIDEEETLTRGTIKYRMVGCLFYGNPLEEDISLGP